MKKNLSKFLIGTLGYLLITSPISEKPGNKLKYNSLNEFLSSKDYLECTLKSNLIRYLPDSVKYGKEYWQSFEETNSLKSGDCNDKSPYLCNLLNQKYPGFHIKMGYKYLDNPKSAHFWISHGEDESIILDPNYTKIRRGLDTSYFVAILDKDTLPSKLYYEKYLKGNKRNLREFRKRTGIRIPIKNPQKR